MSTPSIDALTVPALSAALDAALVRQQVIAHNIANAHTEGFRPQRVSFDVSLAAAHSQQAAPQVSVDARIETPAGLSIDGAVRLDAEVAAMAQNHAHYQALVKALNRHLSVLAIATSDGKR